MIYYENTIKNFLRDVNGKRLVDFLASEYEERTSEKISSDYRFAWKYLLQILKDRILEANARPDCGIRIDMELSTHTTHVSFLFASEENGEYRYSIIGMYSGSYVSMTKAEDIVVFREGESEWAAIHPSRQMDTQSKKLIRRIPQDEIHNINVESCVFLFDCLYRPETDIISRYDTEDVVQYPIFYANDEADLVDFVSPTIRFGNGEKALRKLREIEKNQAPAMSDEITEDQLFLISSIVNNVLRGRKALYIIEGQTGTRKSAVVDKVEQALLARGKTIVRLDDINVTEEKHDLVVAYQKNGVSYDQLCNAPVGIYICDELRMNQEDIEKLDQIKEAASREHSQLYVSHLKDTLAFPDNGDGMRWLLNELQIADFDSDDYDPSLYSIELFSSADKLPPGDESLASVLLDDTVVFDSNEEKISMSAETKEKIYSSLSKRPNGVRIVCKDPSLCDYLKSRVETLKLRRKWLDVFVQNTLDENEEGIRDSEEMLSNNMTICSSYEAFARSALGDYAWGRLSKESRVWILSAIMSYDHLKDYNQLLDFSGVCVEISKACEKELTYRFYEQFIVFLCEKYGNNFIKKLPYECLETDKDGKIVYQIKDPVHVTLGSIRFITGIDTKGNITSQYGWNEFEDYAKTELLVNTDNIKEQVVNQLIAINKIKNDYRNRSAHKEAMSVIDAKECIEYVVSVSRKLGEFLDAYRF